jgi:hypothetical protein
MNIISYDQENNKFFITPEAIEIMQMIDFKKFDTSCQNVDYMVLLPERGEKIIFSYNGIKLLEALKNGMEI